MPLPTPSKREKKSDFITRCMTDANMGKEFQDPKQRYAVCQRQYERNK